MADKPSRGLVIYGDGCASMVSSSHSHLHSFASLSSCGFLSLRDSPPYSASEPENARVIREIAQLLDAYDFYLSMNEKQTDASPPKVSERFMGLRAAIITSCPNVQSFVSTLGFTVFQLDEIINKELNGAPLEESSNETMVAYELLRLLGFSEGDVLEKCEFDFVFLHLMSSENSIQTKGKTIINTSVNWLNKLVGNIMQIAQPRSSIASRLHFSVVLSYDNVSEGVEPCALTLNSSKEMDSDLNLLRPHQSYAMRGGKILNGIRHHHPMLIAQFQKGVTRKDLAKAFSFKEFKEDNLMSSRDQMFKYWCSIYGGNLAILADRFLHEVAFKLWKAPKYGA